MILRFGKECMSYLAKHELEFLLPLQHDPVEIFCAPNPSSAEHVFGFVVPLRHANPLNSFAPLDFFS